MALYTINSGEFKHKIEIGKYISNQVDEDNIPINKFLVKLQAKAQIINKSGKELIAADGENQLINKRFYIRYPKHIEVNYNDTLIYNGKNYNIIYASNVKEQGKYLEIVCELVE